MGNGESAMNKTVDMGRHSAVVSLVMALALAWVVAPTDAAAHPAAQHKDQDNEVASHPLAHPGDEHMIGGLVVQVNSPAEVAGQLPAVQWADTPQVADETADLVYAGTGCTVASYTPVADQVRGNIALVESRVSATNPSDTCPAYTFAQKVRAAQAAGAIGFVHIPGEGEDWRTNATAVSADIPALEVQRTAEAIAVRDAAIAGETNATLTDTREPLEAMSDIPCQGGMAGPFECEGVDLLSFVPQEEFNGAGVSDLWGWTDPDTGDEYVVAGKTNGVAFFRVTDPTAPEYLGELPNPAILEEIWHDIKMYENHAFIVSESEPHGMTVFDLTRLRDVTEPQQWDADARYPLNVAAHNLAINEDTGYAYIVGGNEGIVAPDHCLSGLHMVDIRDPKDPTFAGCYAVDGGPGTAARTAGLDQGAAYVHDTQCVIYEGPDKRYTGRELCFNASENKVVIADVTDKRNPVTVGMTPYSNVSYAHQGWLTEDQAFFIANDELDETTHDTNTRTIVLDVRDLENPTVHFEHIHATTSIDHNNYVHEGRVYQSNYTSGLRVLDATNVDDPDNPRLDLVGFFDTFPWSGAPTFDGTWSNYPYFESGTIAVSGIDEGLFLVRLADDGEVEGTRPGHRGKPSVPGPPPGKGPKR
ncbi:MAG: choice-of-anchor B family protein [Nitriliruptorales bacterium]|nr:choice-of-anchor B family protein [Nitriliruptorales bacterium]